MGPNHQDDFVCRTGIGGGSRIPALPPTFSITRGKKSYFVYILIISGLSNPFPNETEAFPSALYTED